MYYKPFNNTKSVTYLLLILLGGLAICPAIIHEVHSTLIHSHSVQCCIIPECNSFIVDIYTLFSAFMLALYGLTAFQLILSLGETSPLFVPPRD